MGGVDVMNAAACEVWYCVRIKSDGISITCLLDAYYFGDGFGCFTKGAVSFFIHSPWGMMGR